MQENVTHSESPAVGEKRILQGFFPTERPHVDYSQHGLR